MEILKKQKLEISLEDDISLKLSRLFIDSLVNIQIDSFDNYPTFVQYCYDNNRQKNEYLEIFHMFKNDEIKMNMLSLEYKEKLIKDIEAMKKSLDTNQNMISIFGYKDKFKGKYLTGGCPNIYMHIINQFVNEKLKWQINYFKLISCSLDKISNILSTHKLEHLNKLYTNYFKSKDKEQIKKSLENLCSNVYEIVKKLGNDSFEIRMLDEKSMIISFPIQLERNHLININNDEKNDEKNDDNNNNNNPKNNSHNNLGKTIPLVQSENINLNPFYNN